MPPRGPQWNPVRWQQSLSSRAAVAFLRAEAAEVPSRHERHLRLALGALLVAAGLALQAHGALTVVRASDAVLRSPARDILGLQTSTVPAGSQHSLVTATTSARSDAASQVCDLATAGREAPSLRIRVSACHAIYRFDGERRRTSSDPRPPRLGSSGAVLGSPGGVGGLGLGAGAWRLGRRDRDLRALWRAAGSQRSRCQQTQGPWRVDRAGRTAASSCATGRGIHRHAATVAALSTVKLTAGLRRALPPRSERSERRAPSRKPSARRGSPVPGSTVGREAG
jgi:hypothetical protein